MGGVVQNARHIGQRTEMVRPCEGGVQVQADTQEAAAICRAAVSALDQLSDEQVLPPRNCFGLSAVLVGSDDALRHDHGRDTR